MAENFCQIWAVPEWHSHSASRSGLCSSVYSLGLALHLCFGKTAFTIIKNQVLKLLLSLRRMEKARLTSSLAFWEKTRGPENVSLLSSLISFLGKVWWPELRCGLRPKNLEVGFWLPLSLASLQAVVSGPQCYRSITWFPEAIRHSLHDYGCHQRKGNSHR